MNLNLQIYENFQTRNPAENYKTIFTMGWVDSVR